MITEEAYYQNMATSLQSYLILAFGDEIYAVEIQRLAKLCSS
jgi:hypothetical protein